jgi:hypothetical protein
MGVAPTLTQIWANAPDISGEFVGAQPEGTGSEQEPTRPEKGQYKVCTGSIRDRKTASSLRPIGRSRPTRPSRQRSCSSDRMTVNVAWAGA